MSGNGYKTSARQQGFTLVEVLVALTIFAIGLLSIAGMQITALRESNKAFTRDVSGVLAQGILDTLLSLEGDDPIFVNTAATGWDFDPDTAGVQPWQEAGTYNATYAIAVNNPINKIARLNVVVTGAGRTTTLIGYKRLP